MGEYPAKLDETGELNIGRGRVIPTTPWEALWKGLAQWLDVEEDQLDTILPNMKNFESSQLFSKDILFNTD